MEQHELEYIVAAILTGPAMNAREGRDGVTGAPLPRDAVEQFRKVLAELRTTGALEDHHLWQAAS
jgi:hypothetical protein